MWHDTRNYIPSPSLSLVARHNPLERYFDSSEVDVLEDNKVVDDESNTEKEDDDVSFEEDFFASDSSSSEEPRKEDVDHEIRDIIQDRVREMQVGVPVKCGQNAPGYHY